MLNHLIRGARRMKRLLDRRRLEQRWAEYRALGMHIGENVSLPASTWIDESFCFLISIGDNCGFGERCLILAHDAQMHEFLGPTRVGRVLIHPSCHIGAGTLILPGIEMGPRTIVAAGSVVTRPLPPDSLCAGVPARPVCSLDEYFRRQREQTKKRPHFPYETYKDAAALAPEQKAEMLRALADGDAYIT